MRESDLPGIGRKFQADLRSGERVVVVIHDDGRREVYQFDRKDFDNAKACVDLDDDEARQLAGILGGMSYTPRAMERVEVAFDALVIEWHRVEAGSRAADSTIGDLGVRQNFGATVIAVIKGDRQVINPGPEVRIEADSTLVIAGERDQVKAFQDVLARV